MSDLNPYEEGLAIDLAKAHARIEELEAKLEKAVAIAKDAIETMECGPFFPDQESQRLLADLAAVTGPHKLTGGKDE